MWSASIEAIYDTPVPSGDKVVHVKYTDGPREITQTYHVRARAVASAQDVTDFLQAEIAKLEIADAIENDLKAILGQSITATSAPEKFGVPKAVSDRQFFHALAKLQIISEDEALAAVATGSIPQAMLTVVNKLPEAARFDVRMFLSGAVEFQRNHSLVAQFGAAIGWTEGQIDDLFKFAGSL